jgi:hypothetical protein
MAPLKETPGVVRVMGLPLFKNGIANDDFLNFVLEGYGHPNGFPSGYYDVGSFAFCAIIKNLTEFGREIIFWTIGKCRLVNDVC